MTCVCLSNFGTPTGAASVAELAALLLERAPRVRVEGQTIWADARGLHARSLADALQTMLRAQGCAASRAGISRAPVAARVASCFGSSEVPVVEIAPGYEREYLAPFPLQVLDPPPDIASLLDGVGIERCGELADLAREDIEVRFGPEAVAIWRLARADDRRLLFGPAPRALPQASLEWTDYELRDTERLLFVINRLAGNVTAALREQGQGARTFTLTFGLARGGSVEHPFHPSRATADQRAWIRLIRHALERERLPDLVSGIGLRVDAVFPSESVQGDLLDRGFATAREAESAMARVLDQGARLVAPKTNRHPLLRRRSAWVPQESSLVWARPQIGPGDVEPELVLHLLLEPEPIEVESADRRLVAASGPDCVSGGRWEGDAEYAWELYCCVRADGELIQLGRDARTGAWALHGSWR